MAFIENELKKRRGEVVQDESSSKTKEYDPQEELYRVAEAYALTNDPTKQKTQEEEEGNITTSLGMLTSIPEVDLGMDIRLKNIEETERAKRELMNKRGRGGGGQGKKWDEADESFAAARCECHFLVMASYIRSV